MNRKSIVKLLSICERGEADPEKLTQWLNALKLYIPRIIHVISPRFYLFLFLFSLHSIDHCMHIKMFDLYTQQPCWRWKGKNIYEWDDDGYQRAHSKLINLFSLLTHFGWTWNQSEIFLFPSSPRQWAGWKLMGENWEVKWKITWHVKALFHVWIFSN